MRCDAQWAIPVDQEILQTNLKEVFLKKTTPKSAVKFPGPNGKRHDYQMRSPALTWLSAWRLNVAKT